MSRTTVYTDQQLLEFSEEHLLYEVYTFKWLMDNFPKTTGVEQSVHLESFLMHL
jgi:hypothetical protein